MKCPILLHTMTSGWYIVYIERSHVIVLYFFLCRSILFQCTRLKVSGPQRVEAKLNYKRSSIVCTFNSLYAEVTSNKVENSQTPGKVIAT